IGVKNRAHIAWGIALFAAVLGVLIAPSPAHLFTLEARGISDTRVAANRLNSIVLDKITPPAKALYIYDTDDGFQYYVTMFTVSPVQLEQYDLTTPFISDAALQAPIGEHNSVEAFEALIRRVDYIIVDDPYPLFWLRYG